MMNAGSDEQIFGEIRDFIHETWDVPKRQISPATSLGRDLRMDGDDADDFMAAYRERFKVDLTDFIFEKHFGVEAAFEPLSYLYLRIFRPEEFRKPEITVADLVSAAKAGRWNKVV
jgi:acyl carrier protein